MADKKERIKEQGEKEISHQIKEEDCVWKKAGVINSRVCDHDYDCQNCLFDLGMRSAMGLKYREDVLQPLPGWMEHLKRHFKGGDRPCCHALMGRIDGPKLCTFNYECHHCPFDQMLDDMDYAQSRVSV